MSQRKHLIREFDEAAKAYASMDASTCLDYDVDEFYEALERAKQRYKKAKRELKAYVRILEKAAKK